MTPSETLRSEKQSAEWYLLRVSFESYVDPMEVDCRMLSENSVMLSLRTAK